MQTRSGVPSIEVRGLWQRVLRSVAQNPISGQSGCTELSDGIVVNAIELAWTLYGNRERDNLERGRPYRQGFSEWEEVRA